MEDLYNLERFRQKRSVFAVGWIACAALTLFAGCGKTAVKNSSSRMTVTFPSAAQLRSPASHKIQASAAYDFSKACFAINITGASVKPTVPSSKCDVPVGIFQGFVAPGGSISMMVPNGTGYKLEVFAYSRATAADPCPSSPQGMTGVEASRVATVGVVPAFDAITAEVAVNVEISAPTSNLAIDRNLPVGCSSSTVNSIFASAAITSGRQVQTGGGYKLVGAVTGTTNETKLSGGAYVMRLSRRPQ